MFDRPMVCYCKLTKLKEFNIYNATRAGKTIGLKKFLGFKIIFKF